MQQRQHISHKIEYNKAKSYIIKLNNAKVLQEVHRWRNTYLLSFRKLLNLYTETPYYGTHFCEASFILSKEVPLL